MVNRTMQAKRFKLQKQKRMRRAYLKQYFGVIKVGQSVDKSRVPRGAEGIFDYRDRGNTFWDAYMEAKFPRRYFKISAERAAVIDKLNSLTQEVLPEMNVVVKRGGITKTIIRFFFASDYKLCFFMLEDWLNMVMYKSIVYHGAGSRDRAMFDLQNNRITYVERIDIPTES